MRPRRSSSLERRSAAASPPPRPAAGRRRRDGSRAELARLRALYRIANILTTQARSENVLKMILRETVRATRATSGSLILIDRRAGVLNIEIAQNIDAHRARRLKLAIGQGVTGWVARTGRPLLVGDVRRSRHYVKLKADVKSELAAPLIVGGEVIGVLNVDSNRLNAFAEPDLELLVAIAAQSSRVMHAARLNEEVRRKAARLATLFTVARSIVSDPLMEDVLKRVADAVRRLMDARVCSIMLLDDKEANLEIKAVSGEVSPAYIARRRIPVGGSVIGRVVQTGRPLYVADVRREPGYRLGRVARVSGLCSLLSIPMAYLARPIGVLNVYTATPAEFTDEDVELMTAFAGHCAVGIVNAQRYERIIRADELLRQREKLQLLGILSAEIAHEIRNPLTILSMLVHSIQAEAALTPESRTDLEVMETRLKGINRILDQVLDFARAQQIEPAPVEVNRVIDDVRLLIGHKAAAMGRRVVRRCREGLPPVLGDPVQIEQAVLNLALNGLEAIQAEGTTLMLSTRRARRDGVDWVVIAVRDDGHGIPPGRLESLFSPFFSTRRRGTGLGLFITRRIVKEHGGELRLKSREGIGTAFEIWLPAGADGGPSAALPAGRSPSPE